MTSVARLLVDDLLDLFFPTRCLGCDRRGQAAPGEEQRDESNGWFCSTCVERSVLTQSLDHCLLCNRLVAEPGQLCPNDRARTNLNGLQSFGSYRIPELRRAVHLVKFGGHWAGLGPLAEAARHRLQLILARPWSAVIPIPLHPARRRGRGFNQAEQLARGWQLQPLVTRGLIRTRSTKQQATLSRGERASNVADAFCWTGLPLGGRVLLVDDVATTGATLGAAAKTLRRAGAREVWAVTLAYEPLS